MKKVSIEEFEALLQPIKIYLDEYEKCNKAVGDLCSSSYAVIDLGCKLLGSYIDLVEKLLEDDDWIAWFVFDNEFGKNKMYCESNDKKYVIESVSDMYNFLTNM